MPKTNDELRRILATQLARHAGKRARQSARSAGGWAHFCRLVAGRRSWAAPLGCYWEWGPFGRRTPHINKLFGELALVLAPVGSAIECLHVCAEDNALADELSRMTAGSRVPACLNRVPRTAWHSTDQWWIV